MYSNNRGDQLLPMLLDNKPLTGQDGIYASSSLDKATNELILKIVNTSGKSQTRTIFVETAKRLAPKGKLTILQSESIDCVNSISEPKKVSPLEKDVVVKGKKLELNTTPYSMNILRIKLN